MPGQDPEDRTVTMGKVFCDEMRVPSLLRLHLSFSFSCHKHRFFPVEAGRALQAKDLKKRVTW